MKDTLLKIGIAIIAALGVTLWITTSRMKTAEKKWKAAEANVKAYDKLLGSANNQNAALALTIDQLNNCQDSILRELNETRKQLKIKNKDVKAVQYIESTFIKTDTIVLKDTLFKEPDLKVDTIIGDRWYNVKVGLKYPSTITVNPKFNSEKHVIVSTKKETVNPPKKFFLLRWFQKKHKVLTIDVVEKNPYIENQNSRYVEVLK